MSTFHDSESQKTAVAKAQEGQRSLSAGGYERAIAALAEAIRLAPNMAGARRTRAEATRHLQWTRVKCDQPHSNSGSPVTERAAIRG